MKFLLMYAGSALIGVITTLLGMGYINNGHLNVAGTFLNILSVIVWVSFVHVITKDKKE